MKVILRKEHEKLGPIGTLTEVKDGYARNYLIPRGIAYPATNGQHARTGGRKEAGGTPLRPRR